MQVRVLKLKPKTKELEYYKYDIAKKVEVRESLGSGALRP